MTSTSASSGRSDVADRTRPPVTAYGRTVAASYPSWAPMLPKGTFVIDQSSSHRGSRRAVDGKATPHLRDELRRQGRLGARDQERHLVADEADVAVGLGDDAQHRPVRHVHEEQEAVVHLDDGLADRSEERRVGKGCGSRGAMT